ncbi:MAG: Hsp20/alpha crystallin family protein [Deltaproteobacteria bacterium]|nr:Hsp20/alpha crystallin family protein [Deltaproteobacteria bacterium]
MTMNRWDPLREMLSIQERMTRLADKAFHEVVFHRRSMWKPAVDVLETPGEYIARMDLPGVNKEEINIEIKGSRLTIQGERRIEAEPPIAAYHSIERETGYFERSFLLPGDVDAEQAEARYQDGVLVIRVPKAEQAREREVTIVCSV